jgi:hypothetical protein
MTTWMRMGAGGGAALFAVALGFGCSEEWEPAQESHAQVERDAGTNDEVRMAPEPERLSEEQVREELERLPPERELGVPDFQRLLRMIPAAQTPLALQWTMAHASHIGQGRPGRSSEAFYRRLERQLERALVGEGFSTDFSAGTECHVGFDNPESLAAIPNAAQDSFAWAPHYFEPCRTGFIRFEPLNHGHYHLGYEDPNITCVDIDNDWRFGRMVDGECIALEDPTQEARSIGAHHGNQVIRLRYHTGGGLNLPLPFALRYFINVGGEPVKIRFRNTDGEWYGWNSLAGYTVWLLSPVASDIEELFITHADTALDCGPDWGMTTGGSTCPFGEMPFFVDHFGIEP